MVSVIISNYNYQRYLMDCFRSVISEDCEIIFIDDASTDDSREIAKRWHFDHVIFHSKNLGVARSRNDGIQLAKGDYIVCLDADDMLIPGGLEKRAHQFEKYPDLDVVYGQARVFYGDRDFQWCRDHRRKLRLYKRPWKRHPHTQTIMYHRRVFEKYGLFYEKLRSKEDKEFVMRIGLHRLSPRKTGISFKEIKNDVVFYRKHDKNKHKLRNADKRWKKTTDKIFNARMKDIKNGKVIH